MRFFLTSFFLLYCWQAALFGQYDMYYCVPSGGNVDVYLDSDYSYCPSGQRITVIDSATGATRLAGASCNFGGVCILSNTCPVSPSTFNISTSPSTWTITSTVCKDGDTYMRPNTPTTTTTTPAQTANPQAIVQPGNCFNVPNPPAYKYRFLPPPVISISTSAGNPICVGSSTVLTADCVGSDICLYEQSYLWSNGATTASITIAPGAPGITSYFVTVTQPGFTTTCPIVASYDVTATASSAIVEINGNSSPSVTLTSCTFPYNIVANCTNCGGGQTYQWAGSGGFSGNANFVTLNGSGGGSLTVTENGCQVVKTINLNVGASPTVSISASTNNTCVGASAPVVTSSVTNCAGCAYAWNSGETTPNINISTASGQGFLRIVTVTNASGCVGTSNSTSVVVNDLPGVTLSGTSICNGDNTNLPVVTSNCGGGCSYSWTNGLSGANPAVNPGSTTPYTVTVTNSYGCEKIATATVTVNALPSLGFLGGSNETICSGSITTITPIVSPVIDYLWTGGAVTSTITANTAGVYALTVTDANGCQAVNSKTIALSAGITPTFSPSSLGLCPTGATTKPLQVGTYSSYLWSNGATTQGINVSSAGNYTVTVTSGGCTGTNTINVSMITPSAFIGIVASANPIPSGNSTVISTSDPSYATYAWASGQATQSINVSPGATTTYTLTVTDANGCTALDALEITVTAPSAPVVVATPNLSVCNGSVANFGITCTSNCAGITYLWNTGANTSNTTALPTLAGVNTYTVTATNSNSATTIVNISVYNTSISPIVSISPNPVVSGNAVNISCNTIAGATYSWSSGQASSSFSATPTVNTTYVVTISNNGCQGVGAGEVTVTAASAPVVTITPTLSICAGTSANFGVTCTSNCTGVTYLWSNSATTANVSTSPGTNTNYIVTVTNSSGGTITANVSVTVYPSVTATVSISPNPVISGNAVTVSCNTITGASYTWSSGQTTSSFLVTPTVNTTYTVTISNNGCQGVGSGLLTVTSASAPALVASSVSICPGSTANFGVTCTANCTGATYIWSNGATTSNTTASPASTTNYTVTVTNSSSGVSVATVSATVYASPVITFSGVGFYHHLRRKRCNYQYHQQPCRSHFFMVKCSHYPKHYR